MRENSKLTPHAKDQVLGCMVGGAVGDALGYAVEFTSYDSIVGKYGAKGITCFDLDRHGVASQIFEDSIPDFPMKIGTALPFFISFKPEIRYQMKSDALYLWARIGSV